MTVTSPTAGSGGEVQRSADLVHVSIDGFETDVPKGTLVIRAAELLGISIPRFCDHPLLDPVGACRQCLIEVEGQRKPLASCTTTVTDGMVVRTQLTSPVADKAQQGVMELLLINHPLDCPVCDKGGECPLQNQAMSNGRPDSRYEGVKRTFPKPVAISSEVLLDRERCVLCARCTRFSNQIAGDPFIELLERGALQQVGIYEEEPFDSYFSGNTVQICPVGALTGAAYRFRARPFDLVSSPSVCEHCASGCALRTDHRRGRVMRRLAAEDAQVNEEWNCDKGRWAFTYAQARDRLSAPLVRNEDGRLVPTSWPDALATAAEGLARAREAGGVGVLPGGRVTLEDGYAYGKFARAVLGTNDVDFRARPGSAEEEDFLAARVAGLGPNSGGVTYADLEAAPSVLLVAFEPEEESPIVFLRLRKAVRKRGQRVFAIAPFASRGLDKLSGTLLRSAPGDETGVIQALLAGRAAGGEVAAALSAGGVVLVGERAAAVPGLLSAVSRLATASGARLAWIPRRAGERGAVEAGLLPGLLPGGRRSADAVARVDVGTVWGVEHLPAAAGRAAEEMLAAVLDGDLAGLLVGGVDPDDLPDPVAAVAALEAASFVVSLEQRESEVTRRASVVLPVASVAEKAGSFLDWEGRLRSFSRVLQRSATGPNAMSDGRVLHAIAEAMGVDLRLPDPEAAWVELAEIGVWEGGRPEPPAAEPMPPARAGRGSARLATWHLLLDDGKLQAGEPFLAGTARPAVARLSPTTAAEVGATQGGAVTVSTMRGALTLPLEIAEMPDRVVWVPTNSGGSGLRRALGAGYGDLVSIAGASLADVAAGSRSPVAEGVRA